MECELDLRPSGAFVSTVRDLAKWDAALYGDTILTASARERMWQPAAQTDRKSDDGTNYSYGFGWQIALVNGHKEVSHGGTLAGFRAALVRFVDDKLTVVVLTNVGNASPDTIARGVAALYVALEGVAQNQALNLKPVHWSFRASSGAFRRNL